MLIANHTLQIYVPMESVNCFVITYRQDDPNNFYKGEKPAEGDKRDKPVELNVVSNGAYIKFSELYGSKAKADEAMRGLVEAYKAGHALYVLPLDAEYLQFLQEERERKKKEAEQQRPAYAIEEGNPNG